MRKLEACTSPQVNMDSNPDHSNNPSTIKKPHLGEQTLESNGDGDSDGVDRISQLPDEILHHILSLMPTNYAATTTFLSTRWKHLFASIPNLRIDLDWYSIKRCRFPVIMDSVLDTILRDVRYIDTLHLCSHQLFDNHSLTSWICSASRFEVRDLSMIFCSQDLLAFPPSFLCCKTLVNLMLHGLFKLDIPGSFCLPNLEYLDLEDVVFPDSDSARRLFSGCPRLNTLIIDMVQYEHLDVLDVSSSSLLVLKITTFFTVGQFGIVLDTPNLNTLRHCGWIAKPYKVKNPHCLSVADLHFNLKTEELEEGARFVAACSQVRVLSLSNDLMKAFHEFPQLMPTFPNLAELNLDTIDKYGWKVLPQLLEKSPSLEVLAFAWGISSCDDGFTEFVSRLTDHVPMCLSSRLQEIEFHTFNGEEEDFKVVEYFLKSASVLMKMKIKLAFCLNWWSSISEKLLKLPKCSKTCKILLG